VEILSQSNNKRISWSIVIQLATFLLMTGIAYASLQTKAEAKAELKFIAETYVTKELSNERWSNNAKDHDIIVKRLDDILKELRRSK
jgi:hypothetical protein